MGKLKALFSNISTSIKETYKKFPVTIIIAYIITFIYAFGTDEFINNLEKENWLAVLIIWAIGTFFVETCFTKKTSKGIGACASLLISIGFKTILSNENIDSFWYRLLTAYVTVLPLLTLYKTIKNSQLEIKEYGLNVLSNFGKCTTIYILANLGILLVLFVFIELILNGEYGDIISKALILLLGGYYIPSLINAVTDVTSEAGKFIKVLIMYVFTPVGTFLIGILYLYIIKIGINGELLHNQIFFMLSLTFSVMTPVTLLLKNYDQTGKINKFTNILIYLFIPLILLQIIAMGIRVSEYGLTETRYMAYLLIVFEIVFISLILVKNSKHLDKSILFLSILVIFALISPLNIEKVPVMSQVNRIEKMISNAGSFENLTDEEKVECKKAFVFVDYSEDREYLYDTISVDILNKIENYDIMQTYKEDYYEDYNYISFYEKIDGLDISEFSTIYKLHEEYYKKEKDYSKYQVNDRENQIVVNINIENMIDEIIKADKENRRDEVFEKYRLLDSNVENIKIYLTEFRMNYEIYSREIDSLNIEGYILVK